MSDTSSPNSPQSGTQQPTVSPVSSSQQGLVTSAPQQTGTAPFGKGISSGVIPVHENPVSQSQSQPQAETQGTSQSIHDQVFEASQEAIFVPHPADIRRVDQQSTPPEVDKSLSYEVSDIPLDQDDINEKAAVVLAEEVKQKNSELADLQDQKNKSEVSLFMILGVILLTAALVIGGGVATIMFFPDQIGLAELSTSSESADEDDQSSPTEIVREVRDVQITNEDSAVVDVAKNATDSVVSVLVLQDVGGGRQGPQLGAGTGFVVSTNGYIVTNRHVVNTSGAVFRVVFPDGDVLDAELVDIDPFLDIAFLRIDTQKELTPLTLSDSDEIQIGQTAIAIGNSLGQFSNSVSKGIISGLGRSILATAEDGSNADQLDDIIQTDASINPGNSGGPLLDIGGNVMGVNVAKAQTGENIGFAIPINAVKPILRSVLDSGRIVRPFMGLRYVQITPEYADVNNLPVNYGIHITSDTSLSAIELGGPSDAAGLVDNDIIIDIDGQRLDTDIQLQTFLLNNYAPGDTITLQVLRGEDQLSLQLTLGEFPRVSN
jgi:S1-C subfamily serine protease